MLIDMLIADKMNRWVALTIAIIGGLIWGIAIDSTNWTNILKKADIMLFACIYLFC